MTTTTSSDAAPVPRLRLVVTLLELAALGVVGAGIIGTLGALLGAGVGLTFVFGIGLVLLVGLVYALYGVAWFEVARVDGLYGLGLTSLRLRPRTRPGFGGWLRSLGRQAIDGGMWRALAHFALACILGALVLRVAAWFGWSVVTAFSPLFTAADADTGWGTRYPVAWAPLVGALGAI